MRQGPPCIDDTAVDGCKKVFRPTDFVSARARGVAPRLAARTPRRCRDCGTLHYFSGARWPFSSGHSSIQAARLDIPSLTHFAALAKIDKGPFLIPNRNHRHSTPPSLEHGLVSYRAANPPLLDAGRQALDRERHLVRRDRHSANPGLPISKVILRAGNVTECVRVEKEIAAFDPRVLNPHGSV